MRKYQGAQIRVLGSFGPLELDIDNNRHYNGDNCGYVACPKKGLLMQGICDISPAAAPATFRQSFVFSPSWPNPPNPFRFTQLLLVSRTDQRYLISDLTLTLTELLMP